MVSRPLAERDPPANKKGAGKLRFLAHKNEIVQAMERGWNQKDIWQDLRDRAVFVCSYSLFTKYVARYIEGKEPKQLARNTTPKGMVEAGRLSGGKVDESGKNQEEANPDGPIRVQGVKLKEGVKHQPQAGSVKDSDLF